MDAQTLTAAAALAASLAGGAVDQPMNVTLDCGSQFCKATPSMEGGERVLYMEASNEAIDVQNERILASALEKSKDYFLKYGRIDLDHATVWKMIRETKLDPSNPYAREIGRPLDVRITRRPGDIPRVWVKAAIFRSADKDNNFTRAANWFWDTMQTTPPVAWFPSVAGALLPGGRENDPTGARIIKALRWHSIGLSRNPVNTGIDGAVSTVPLEVFCKALSGGLDVSSALSMMAGYKTAPPVADPDMALRRAGIQVPVADGGSIPAGLSLSPERAALIHQSILEARPPFDLGTWLAQLAQAGVPPIEGMAYLLAILHDGKQLSLGINPVENGSNI